ncbi:MAG: DNA-directed RNA polymerase subunit alpha [Chloroflexota bacterium]|nr:DNA-directed RNA polymerase subunit alpha [Chloroflexota bacterium]MDE2895657.1 DNA-directed RNA polymerase subunit alpha [Chloroflexota bacterium]
MILATDTPNLSIEEERDDYVRIAVEPLRRGFAHTVGNAMRRVLLSGIRGAAITSVRIDQVQHEFSTIPEMKEDTTEFLLNLREIRIHAIADRPAEMHLNVTGASRITAGDIEVPGDYKIVNPDLYLATLDGDDGRLDVVMDVETGFGFQPSERSQNGEHLLGVIPLDAVFTPVRKVSYEVLPASGGRGSEYEQLLIETWTDGTITGMDAVQSAARSLRTELELFETMGQPITARQLPAHARVGLTAEQYDMPIEELALSVRAHNCLKRSGLMLVGQILEKSDDELLTLRNFGEKSYIELIDKLLELNLIDEDDPRVRRARDGVFAPSSEETLTTLPPVPEEPSAVPSLAAASTDEAEPAVGGEEDPEITGSLGAALLEALREAGSSVDE